MRNLMMTLACLLTVSAFYSHAQTEKGSFMISGEFDVLLDNRIEETRNDTFYADYNRNQRQFSVSLQGSYFVKDDLAIGLTMGYDRENFIDPKNPKSNDDAKSENITYTYRVGPNVRHYFSISDELAFFGELHGYYQFGKQKDKINGEESDDPREIVGYGGRLRPGITWFVSETVGINLSVPGLISYTYRKEELNLEDQPGGYRDTEEWSTFNTNFSLSNLSLGVSVFL